MFINLTVVVCMQQGHIVFDSPVVASHLAAAGVPEHSIVCDWSTWDTVGNAVFTRQVPQTHAAAPLHAPTACLFGKALCACDWNVFFLTVQVISAFAAPFIPRQVAAALLHVASPARYHRAQQASAQTAVEDEEEGVANDGTHLEDGGSSHVSAGERARVAARLGQHGRRRSRADGPRAALVRCPSFHH